MIAARLRGPDVPVHLLDADVSRYESVEQLMRWTSEESGYITGQTLPITGGWF